MSRSVKKVLILVAFFSLATVTALADHGLQNASEHANENANLPDLPTAAVNHPEPNENANSNANANKGNGNGDGATAQQNGDHLNHGQCVSATAHETEPPKGETIREVAQNNDLVGPNCVEDSNTNGQGNETSEAAKAGGRDFGQSQNAENGS